MLFTFDQSKVPIPVTRNHTKYVYLQYLNAVVTYTGNLIQNFVNVVYHKEYCISYTAHVCTMNLYSCTLSV